MGILVMLAPITLAFGGLLALNGDLCYDYRDWPICHPGVRTLVEYLPIGSVILGLLIGVVGGGWRVRRDRLPGPWLLVAWTVPTLCCVVAFGLGTPN